MGTVLNTIRKATSALHATGVALLLCGVGLAADESVPRPTLEQLDSIIQKAGNVDGFLADTPQAAQIREDYFHALQAYYGKEKFPRESYDAILNQLLDVNDEVPGFGARLWETTDLGEPYRITVDLKTSGLELKPEAWETKMASWRKRLDLQAGDLYRIQDPEERLSRVQAVLKDVEKRIAGFESRRKRLTKSQAAQESRKFFHQVLPETPGFKEVSAFLVREALDLDNIQTLLNSGDADLMFSALEILKTREGLAIPDVDLPDGALSSILKNAFIELDLPKLEVQRIKKPGSEQILSIPGETECFRVRTRQGAKGLVAVGRSTSQTLEFKPIPRRIHGIWKGIPIKECVGGSCFPEHLEALTPERWATVALQGTQLHHVERNGGYHGYIQQVPLRHKNGIYASVDFGATMLAQRVLIPGPNKELTPSSVYELWLKEAYRHRPKDWRGLVVGQSDAISNAGVVQEIHGSKTHALGRSVGDTLEFSHLDPMAEKLTQIFDLEGDAMTYGGRMIVDGMVPDAGDLRLLSPMDNLDLHDPQTVIQALERGRPEFREKFVAFLLQKRGPILNHPRFQKQVLQWVSEGARLRADEGMSLLMSANRWAPEVEQSMLERLKTSSDVEQRHWIMRWFERNRDRSVLAREAFLQGINDSDPEIEKLAWKGRARTYPRDRLLHRKTLDALTENGVRESTRIAAAESLHELIELEPEWEPTLIDRLEKEAHPKVRAQVASAVLRGFKVLQKNLPRVIDALVDSLPEEVPTALALIQENDVLSFELQKSLLRMAHHRDLDLAQLAFARFMQSPKLLPETQIALLELAAKKPGLCLKIFEVLEMSRPDRLEVLDTIHEILTRKTPMASSVRNGLYGLVESIRATRPEVRARLRDWTRSADPVLAKVADFALSGVRTYRVKSQPLTTFRGKRFVSQPKAGEVFCLEYWIREVSR